MNSGAYRRDAVEPRHCEAIADRRFSPGQSVCTATSSMQFHATMADVTDEER